MLQVASCKLQVASYKLQVATYKLKVRSYRCRATGPGRDGGDPSYKSYKLQAISCTCNLKCTCPLHKLVLSVHKLIVSVQVVLERRGHRRMIRVDNMLKVMGGGDDGDMDGGEQSDHDDAGQADCWRALL